jgi:hypothetical protein
MNEGGGRPVAYVHVAVPQADAGTVAGQLKPSLQTPVGKLANLCHFKTPEAIWMQDLKPGSNLHPCKVCMSRLWKRQNPV